MTPPSQREALAREFVYRSWPKAEGLGPASTPPIKRQVTPPLDRPEVLRYDPEKEESSRPFRCPDCGRRYKDERLLNRCHRTWYHKPKRECPKCGENFRWTRELWKHMRDKHTEVRERNGSGPKMERKKKELTLLSRKRKDWNGMALLTTKRKKSKEVNPLLPIKPKEVNLIPTKPKKVKANQLPTNRKKQAEKPVNPCPVCGKPIKGSLISPQMTKHLRTHQRVKERRVFICESCGRLFTTRRYLKLHIERHEKNKTTPTEIMCHLCGKRLSSLRGLELHKTAAHSNRKNHCNICSKYFASKTGFKSHMELYHENCDDEQSQDQSETPTTTVSYKKRMCYYPSCKSIFRNQLNLQSHVEQMHSISSDPQFMCNLCGRTFVNRKRLSRHSVFHTREKPHKCEICGYAFSQRSSLKAHLANMHGQGHKNQECYPCGQPNCKKTFKCNDYLKKHLLKVRKLRSGGGIATNLNTSVVETVSNNGEDKRLAIV
ncbi:unnamed protein product [Orchesella dallaii]|uniref:C2H2-type domain-containing protein n=1 Tax=Orchesella dallaii TaxID=48710 RepID=A0ABP1RJ29_9HEXA